MNPERTADGSLEQFEEDLERLLVAHAKAGVPELAIPTVLEDRARSLERMGFVPREGFGSGAGNHNAIRGP